MQIAHCTESTAAAYHWFQNSLNPGKFPGIRSGRLNEAAASGCAAVKNCTASCAFLAAVNIARLSLFNARSQFST